MQPILERSSKVVNFCETAKGCAEKIFAHSAPVHQSVI